MEFWWMGRFIFLDWLGGLSRGLEFTRGGVLFFWRFRFVDNFVRFVIIFEN